VSKRDVTQVVGLSSIHTKLQKYSLQVIRAGQTNYLDIMPSESPPGSWLVQYGDGRGPLTQDNRTFGSFTSALGAGILLASGVPSAWPQSRGLRD